MSVKAATQPHRFNVRRLLDDILAPLLVLVAVTAVWEGGVRVFDIKPYILPAPSAIVHRLLTDWGILIPNLAVTVSEILLGFALASVVAISLGILLASSGVFRRSVFPLVIASQTVPVIAIAPVLVIWFGYDIIPRVLVTALIAFFPLTVNTVTGFRAVDPELVRFFRSLNASRLQIFRKLTLPSALPYIFAGLKVAATLSVIGATVGEWVGADRGLGQQIVTDTAQLQTTRVFSAILLLSLSGIALFLSVACVEWISLPWRHSTQARRRFGLPKQLAFSQKRVNVADPTGATLRKEGQR